MNTASTRSGAGWLRPWMQLVEITVSTPIVISYRTARLVLGGWPPNAKERRELQRMVTEKASAFGRAGYAAVVNPPRDTAQFVGNVLAPVHQSVTGNRRRLAGR